MPINQSKDYLIKLLDDNEQKLAELAIQTGNLTNKMIVTDVPPGTDFLMVLEQSFSLLATQFWAATLLTKLTFGDEHIEFLQKAMFYQKAINQTLELNQKYILKI